MLTTLANVKGVATGDRNETMKDERVTYTLEKDGKFYIIENVPARVCEETGEQFFAPPQLIACRR